MRGAGKQPRERSILGVRELTREDLEVLRETRQLPPVQQLRDSHHMLARLIAAGIPNAAAAARAGYSLSRTVILLNDPAFQELVEGYRKIVTAEWAAQVDDYMELGMANMLKAERMLSEKLDKADTEGDTLPTKDLVAISEGRADRFGYGKRQTNLNVNVDFAARLERAIQRSGRVIEGKPEHSPSAQEPQTARADHNPATAGGVPTLKRAGGRL